MSYLPFSHFHSSVPTDVQLYFWSLDETVTELSALLPDPSLLDLPPYVNFKSVKRQQEWLAVRVLLHQVCPDTSVHIKYEESGRPFLQPAIAEFSISHTKGMVSIALAQQSVGIDIEQCGERPYQLRDHFLQPDEFDFSSVSHPETAALFMWSAKESVYKLVDLPGTELKADIRLHSQGGDARYMEFTASVTNVTRSILVRCYQMDGFVLTIATYTDKVNL